MDSTYALESFRNRHRSSHHMETSTEEAEEGHRTPGRDTEKETKEMGYNKREMEKMATNNSGIPWSMANAPSEQTGIRQKMCDTVYSVTSSLPSPLMSGPSDLSLPQLPLLGPNWVIAIKSTSDTNVCHCHETHFWHKYVSMPSIPLLTPMCVTAINPTSGISMCHCHQIHFLHQYVSMPSIPLLTPICVTAIKPTSVISMCQCHQFHF